MDPITRNEQYLQGAVNAASGQATGDLPEPVTREEKYLKELVDALENGGGSSLPEVTSADNGKVLKVEDGEWGAGTVATEFPCSGYDDQEDRYIFPNTSVDAIYEAYQKGVVKLTDPDGLGVFQPLSYESLTIVGMGYFGDATIVDGFGNDANPRSVLFQDNLGGDGVEMILYPIKETTLTIVPTFTSLTGGTVPSGTFAKAKAILEAGGTVNLDISAMNSQPTGTAIMCGGTLLVTPTIIRMNILDSTTLNSDPDSKTIGIITAYAIELISDDTFSMYTNEIHF